MERANELFERRKAGNDCPMCPDTSAGEVIAELASGKLHLQNDGDYPGYCVLVFRQHAVEIHDLTHEERAQWIEDIARANRAIAEVCQPVKMNVAWLGNACPHLHCHIRPRYYADPTWGSTPIFTPPTRSLSPDEYNSLRDRLIFALNFD